MVAISKGNSAPAFGLRRLARSLVDGRRTLSGLPIAIRDRYAAMVVDARRHLHRRRYDAPIDPYRLYRVDPGRITTSMSWVDFEEPQGHQLDDRFRRPNYRLACRVMSGAWDRERTPFASSVVHRSFRLHFDEEVPWEATPLFTGCWQALQRGETPWGCSTIAACYRRFASLDRLYRRIERDGYRTQAEILDRGLEDPIGVSRPNRYAMVIEGEIAVNVGRSGELLFYDGRNRLAIAKLLGLDEVPVVILTRHRDWQRLRDAIDRGERRPADLPENLQEHPDLLALIEGDSSR